MDEMRNQSAKQAARGSRAVDNLVDFITAFRHELGALATLYSRMPALIEAEHEAVTSGNFNLVRDASAAKMSVCDEISVAHETLVEQARRLPRVAEAITGHPCEAPATLSACLSVMVDLADFVSRDASNNPVPSLTRDLLQRLLAGSTSSLASFLETAESVKPRIEANRLLLEKLARSYQESYRFWIEMAAETQSPYDARGVQKSSSVASGIRVKA